MFESRDKIYSLLSFYLMFDLFHQERAVCWFEGLMLTHVLIFHYSELVES